MSNGFDVRLRNRLLDQHPRRAIDRFESATSASVMPPYFEGLRGQALESAAARIAGQFGEGYTLVMAHLGEALRTELSWVPTDGR